MPEAVPAELHERFQSALVEPHSTLLTINQPEDDRLAFARSVAASMERLPRCLDCRFLYDQRGSALYDRITRLPEYYLTHTETAILRRYAPKIAAATGPVTLFELGAGFSRKTELLLRTYEAMSDEVVYVPIDVSPSALRAAETYGARHHPRVRWLCVNGTYEEAMPLFRVARPALILFLGSSVGTFDDEQFDAFWRRAAQNTSPGDHFLLGVDLQKPSALIEDAYNDSTGLGASFAINIFARMNRELDSGLDLKAIDYDARYSREHRRMEIHGVFRTPQLLRVAPLHRAYHVRRRERVRIAMCRKFNLDTLIPRLERYGFTNVQTYTDELRWYGILLLRRTPVPSIS